MRNHIWLLFLPFFLISCGPPEFENNTRILVKGNLVDQDNSPLNNLEISVNTRKPTSLFSGESHFVLGSGFSQLDGSFAVTSLFDRDNDFSIEIDGEDNYSTYVYATNTEDYVPENFTFNLQTIILYKLSNITYNIERTSPVGTTLRFSFGFQDKDCIEYYDEGAINPTYSNCYQERTLVRTLNDNLPDMSGSFTSLLGSTVVFTYSINEEPEQTQIFVLDQVNYEYNFNY